MYNNISPNPNFVEEEKKIKNLEKELALSKKEYQELCDYLKLNGMNKAEFVRWAFDKLREGD